MPTATITKLNLKAKFLGAFAEPTRLAIVEYLREGERSVGDIVEHLGYPQSRISNHLACLRNCQLVSTRNQGQQVFYRIKHSQAEKVLDLVDQMVAAHAREILACTKI